MGTNCHRAVSRGELARVVRAVRRALVRVSLAKARAVRADGAAVVRALRRVVERQSRLTAREVMILEGALLGVDLLVSPREFAWFMGWSERTVHNRKLGLDRVGKQILLVSSARRYEASHRLAARALGCRPQQQRREAA